MQNLGMRDSAGDGEFVHDQHRTDGGDVTVRLGPLEGRGDMTP